MEITDGHSPAPVSNDPMSKPSLKENVYSRRNNKINDSNPYLNKQNAQLQILNNNSYQNQGYPQMENQISNQNPYDKNEIHKNNVIISSELKNKDEDEEIKKKIHNGFVRKVYGILLFQFIFTFGIVFICQIKKIKNYLNNHITLEAILLSISCAVLLVIFLIIICKPKTLEKSPQNYIVLFMVTTCETIILSYLAILYKLAYVVAALAMVIGICIGVFIFCCFNKIDTKYLFMVLIITIGLVFIYGILILSFRDYYLEFFYCLLGAFIFLLFLIYDTQKLLHADEDGEFHYDTDDYILAALNLYFDIIRMFIEILQIIGRFGGGGGESS